MKFKTGDKVLSIFRGWGVVKDGNHEEHSTEVTLVTLGKHDYTFNRDGRESSTDFAPSLFTEGEATFMGFYPPKETSARITTFEISGKKFEVREI